MELGGHQVQVQEEEEMSMPMVSYGPPIIHESSTLKLLGVAGEGSGNGTVSKSHSREDTRATSVPATSEQPQPQLQAAAAAAGGGGGVKRGVRYRECLKNHAAGIGGHAIDGCGEFMPSGEEGTLEALRCAACNCHRNFHRREVEGETCYFCFNARKDASSRKAGAGAGASRHPGGGPSPPAAGALNVPLALPSISTRPSPLISAAFESRQHDQERAMVDHHHHYQQHHHQAMAMGMGMQGAPLAMIPAQPMTMKKRFRTKFSQEQKEKMWSFAEKLGWRIQKHDEAAVQQFCMELGVKRHVLKVWMHNNKHTLGKRI